MTTVSISGLTWWTSDADLFRLCSEAGCSQNLPKFITFQEQQPTGKSKGIAELEFECEEDGSKLYSYLKSHQIHGRKPTVELEKKVSSCRRNHSPTNPSSNGRHSHAPTSINSRSHSTEDQLRSPRSRSKGRASVHRRSDEIDQKKRDKNPDRTSEGKGRTFSKETREHRTRYSTRDSRRAEPSHKSRDSASRDLSSKKRERSNSRGKDQASLSTKPRGKGYESAVPSFSSSSNSTKLGQFSTTKY